MTTIYTDQILNTHADNLFDDLNLETFLSTLPEDLSSSIDMESFFALSSAESRNTCEENDFQESRSTLAGILNSVPLTGHVPPAPQVPIESRRIIESRRHVENVYCQQDDEKHPQLKQALQSDLFASTYSSSSSDFISTTLKSQNQNLLNADINPPGRKLNLFRDSQSNRNETRIDILKDSVDLKNGIFCQNKKNKDDSRYNYFSPHNAIEKRYRMSINGKIDELRDILNANSTEDIKTNKSSVLRRAIDRIRYLEKENECLRIQLGIVREGYNVVDDGSNVTLFRPQPQCNTPCRNESGGHLPASSIVLKSDPISPLGFSSSSSMHTFSSPGFSSSSSVHTFSSSSPGSREQDWTPLSMQTYRDQNFNFGYMEDGGSPSLLSTNGVETFCYAQTSSPYSLSNVNIPHSPHSNQYPQSRKRLANSSLPFNIIPQKLGTYQNFNGSTLNDVRSHTSDSGYNSSCPDSLMNYSFPNHIDEYNVIRKNFPSSSDHLGANCNRYQTSNHTANIRNGTFTSASLFLVSFCLFMFNPFLLNNGDKSTSIAQSIDGSGMPLRHLLTALSFNWHQNNEVFNYFLSPFFLWFMYAAQWIVALLLILLCARPADLVGGFAKRFGTQIRRGTSADNAKIVLKQWNKSQVDLANSNWVSAASRMKYALSIVGDSIGVSSFTPLSFRGKVVACASLCLHGFWLLLFRFPQFLILKNFRRAMTKNVNTDNTNCPSDCLIEKSPKIDHFHRHLLELCFLDLAPLSTTFADFQKEFSKEPSSCEDISITRLIFSCSDDFFLGWRCFLSGESADDNLELTRLGLVLGLSLKRFLSLHRIGNVILRETEQLAASIGDKNLWLGHLEAPLLKMLLSSAPPEFPRIQPRQIRIFPSQLDMRSVMSSSCPVDSLVLDVVQSELCEALSLKVFQEIVQRKFGIDSVYHLHLKALQSLLSEPCTIVQKSHLNSTKALHSSKDLRIACQDKDSDASIFEDSDQDTIEEFCSCRSAADWWLQVIIAIGSWYSSAPPEFNSSDEGFFLSTCTMNRLPNPPKCVLSSSNNELAILIHLTHNSLSLAISEQSSARLSGRRTSRKTLLDLWLAIRQTCDLISKSSQVVIKSNSNSHIFGYIDEKFITQTIKLVALDWISQVLVYVAMQQSRISSDWDSEKNSDNAMNSNNISLTFNVFLCHLKSTAHQLSASPVIWVARFDALQRLICGANPMRTRLKLLQDITSSNRVAALSHVDDRNYTSQVTIPEQPGFVFCDPITVPL